MHHRDPLPRAIAEFGSVPANSLEIPGFPSRSEIPSTPPSFLTSDMRGEGDGDGKGEPLAAVSKTDDRWAASVRLAARSEIARSSPCRSVLSGRARRPSSSRLDALPP